MIFLNSKTKVKTSTKPLRNNGDIRQDIQFSSRIKMQSEPTTDYL